jgi:hypothetical protein
MNEPGSNPNPYRHPRRKQRREQMRNGRLISLAAVAALGLASSIGAGSAAPQKAQPRRKRINVIRATPHQSEEITAWNAAVDARKAAKRAAQQARRAAA